MSQTVFFSTGDVESVANKLASVTAEYEELFNRLCKQIYTEIAPLTSSSEQVAVALDYVEQSLTAFATHFPDNARVDCAKGCSHCCHFPIETPSQVVEDIFGYLLETRTAEQLESLREAFKHNIAQRQAPLNRAPCPFLAVDNSCSIYHKRPLSCRWFSSPSAGLCQQSLVDGRNIDQHPVQSRIYQAASTALLADQQARTGSAQQLSFIPALLALLDRHLA